MNVQGKIEEVFNLVKEVFKVDFKLYICWYVYGILYCINKNFEEVIKVYKFVFKFEFEL